jgi:hypothetical protein
VRSNWTITDFFGNMYSCRGWGTTPRRATFQGSKYGSSPVETAKALAEAREALRNYETSALADVAATLAETAESLARTAR